MNSMKWKNDVQNLERKCKKKVYLTDKNNVIITPARKMIEWIIKTIKARMPSHISL